VAELRAGLDVAELADWLAYWDAEPWGEPRADQRLAVSLWYQLSPWMQDEAGEPPALAYPYFEDPAEAAAEIAAAREEYQRLEAEWSAAVSSSTGPGGA
jgi:hypothetical protein